MAPVLWRQDKIHFGDITPYPRRGFYIRNKKTLAQQLLYLILAFLLLEFAFEQLLSFLNLKNWKQPLPEAVSDLFTEEQHRKAASYAKHNYYFSLISGTFSLLVTLVFLALGGFAKTDAFVREITQNEILRGLLFFAILGLASALINLPFVIYHTFVIEEKFGFNKTTPAVFVGDKLKGVALSVVLGGGIYALLAWVYGLLGANFWWAAWLVAGSVMVFTAAFYTSVLLPLFNKLTPLEAGPLRTAIEAYAHHVEFPLQKIMVMDGSKRSSKANAFFSGIGSRKSIVLYDTLIQELTVEEITAVLAHEVGHYKKKHVLQSMVLSLLNLAFLLFLFGFMAASPLLAEVLGAPQNSFYLSLVSFSLLYSPVSVLTGIGMNAFSRKNEYEADRFARTTFAAMPLVTSLKKLYVNALGNPNPHPAYVFVHYSHPTLMERSRMLLKEKGNL